MGEVAIRAEGLGKRYRIGERQKYKALRDSLTDAIYTPFRLARSMFVGSSKKTPADSAIWALKDVSFEINQGEVVGVIGRNGAGKSTLLKILSRITEPTEGYVDMHGRVGSLLEVGTGFHPELTGRENIYLNGSIIGMKKEEIDRKFDEIVAFAEIEQFLDTPVKYYSSGMHMRLAFSVAAHLEPEILLVDEVLAVGDAAFQNKCLGKMSDVAKEGRTVLFVSHNMAVVQKLCEIGIVLRQGRVCFTGPIMEATEFYVSKESIRLGTASAHMTKCDTAITIDSVLINGLPYDELILDNVASLEIQISGCLHRSIRLELEARLTDIHEIPLAFFSPGHERGYAVEMPAGPFCLERTIALPRLLRGDYFLSLYLTDPDITGWVDIPHAAVLRHIGQSTVRGRVLESKEGRGWMLLANPLQDETNEPFYKNARTEQSN